MTEQFQSLFRRAEAPFGRAKFLSRIFGIFSEEVVALWASDPRSPFEGLGRPTIKTPGDRRGHTLDFTLRDRSTNLVYVAEMKCEIEYLGFTYFVLERLEQLDHHKKPAFAALHRAAKGDGSQEVYLGGKRIEVHGAILIWGAATDEGKRAAVEGKGFHTVLTVADICRDLASWNHKGFQELIEHRRQWSNELFDGLLHRSVDAAQPSVPSAN